MKVPGIPYVQGRNYQTDSDGHFGIAVHCTSNNATARGEASYAQQRTDGIGSHFYTDKIETIQSIDTLYRVAHAGSANGNNNAICLEQTGFVTWTRQQWLENIHWASLSYALAEVIKAELPGFQVRRAGIQEMVNNPKVRAFYTHNDMRLAWGGTTHTDPGDNYPMDKLIASVTAALGGSGLAPGTKEESYMFVKTSLSNDVWISDGFKRRLGLTPTALQAAEAVGYKVVTVSTNADLDALAGPIASDTPVECVCECECTGDGGAPVLVEHNHAGGPTGPAIPVDSE